MAFEGLNTRHAETSRSVGPSGRLLGVDGIVIRRDDGETLVRGPRNDRILAELPELEVVELQFGPDKGVESHSQADHVDSFYVLDGEAEFVIEDEVFA